MHVIAVGNPFDGITLHGPIVPNTPETEEFLENECRNETWWIIEVQPIPVLEVSPH